MAWCGGGILLLPSPCRVAPNVRRHRICICGGCGVFDEQELRAHQKTTVCCRTRLRRGPQSHRACESRANALTCTISPDSRDSGTGRAHIKSIGARKQKKKLDQCRKEQRRGPCAKSCRHSSRT